MKNILVVGSGAREHAIAWKLAESSEVKSVFLAPGNAASFPKAINLPIASTDVESLASFARDNEIYYTVVGPEAPLAAGIVNFFRSKNLPIFGPTKEAARLESSKIFSKEIMEQAKVPTAKARSFTNIEAAKLYIDELGAPVVIKADGLAAGKGVYVCGTIEEAYDAIADCLENQRFGASGEEILIEEFLEGKEASVMAIIADGNISMLPVSSDYKRIRDKDQGPNTGGMGAISPSRILSEARLSEVKEKVFTPVLVTLRDLGIDYSGFLYAGLMVQSNGDFRVLEFNCRLGDPETQSLMLRIDEDFFKLIEWAIFSPERLPDEVKVNDKTALTVVIASAGYPDAVDDGKQITGFDAVAEDVIVFHAGTMVTNDHIVSKGGRVLSVCALGYSLDDVRDKVYQAISKISFSGMQFRTDIGR